MSTQEFISLYYTFIELGLNAIDSYNKAENKYIEIHGFRKYKTYLSFANVKSRKTKKIKKIKVMDIEGVVHSIKL
jgi:hypothetical protein